MRRASHPERRGPQGGPRDGRPKQSGEQQLLAVGAERSRVAKPFAALIAVDVALMAAGPLCTVTEAPFVCASLREGIWAWFVVMLVVNAFLGSLGGRFIRLTLERRRLEREARPSTT